MTLNEIQKRTVEYIGKLYDRLADSLYDPKTRKARVVITIELDVDIEEEEAEEDVNYKGAFRWDYDHQEAHKAIDEKIRQYFEDQIGSNTLRRLED